MNILDPKIKEYIENIMPVRKEPWNEMEVYAKQTGFPIIGPLVGTLLKQLVLAIKARRIFELGSGYGYSGLWMAQALPADGRIYLTDRKEENRQMALKYFQQSGLAGNMEFLVGDALEIFRKHSGPFDIVLCDMDKPAYPETIPLVKERLRTGGFFIADNIFRSGKIFDKNPDAGTSGVLEFTRKLYDDPDFQTSIMPLRDGITLAVKM